KSPSQGIGSCAKNHIASGTLIWKLDPRFDRIIEVEVYESQTGPVKSYLDRYAYPDRRNANCIVFEADDARYMNHADEPNCDVSAPEESYALRDIAQRVALLGRGEVAVRSEEHTSELQSQSNIACRLLHEKNKIPNHNGY